MKKNMIIRRFIVWKPHLIGQETITILITILSSIHTQAYQTSQVVPKRKLKDMHQKLDFTTTGSGSTMTAVLHMQSTHY